MAQAPLCDNRRYSFERVRKGLDLLAIELEDDDRRARTEHAATDPGAIDIGQDLDLVDALRDQGVDDSLNVLGADLRRGDGALGGRVVGRHRGRTDCG